MLSWFAGQYDRAEEPLNEALAISRRIGERTTRPWLLAVLADVMRRRGQLGEAYALGHEALDLAREIEHGEWLAMSHMTLGFVNLALFRHPQAEEHAAQGYELAAKSGAFWSKIQGRFLQGVVALYAGDIDGAVTLLEGALAQVEAIDGGVLRLLGAPWLVTAYAAQGQVAHARELIDSCLADQTLAEMPELHLTARYAKGHVLTAAGDPTGAEAELQKALALAQQTGNTFFQIEIHGALARLYRDQGQAGDARAHFERVLQVGREVAANIEDPAMREAYLAAAPFAAARSDA